MSTDTYTPSFRDLLVGLYDRLSRQDKDLESIKAQVTLTNGRVNNHDVEIAVIHEVQSQVAKILAAKTKAESNKRDRRMTWKQGIVFAATGAVVASLGLFVVYLTTGSVTF